MSSRSFIREITWVIFFLPLVQREERDGRGNHFEPLENSQKMDLGSSFFYSLEVSFGPASFGLAGEKMLTMDSIHKKGKRWRSKEMKREITLKTKRMKEE